MFKSWFRKIPQYPDFKTVKPEDKIQFERFANNFLPYSDFNFDSFYSWDATSKHKISTLNGNLVAQFTDYITGEPILSFIGKNKLVDTATELLKLANVSNYKKTLKLIPEEIAASLKNEPSFVVTEDPNNHDYIFDIAELSELKGKRYKSKRQLAQKCENLKGLEIFEVSRKDNLHETIHSLMIEWGIEKKEADKEFSLTHELSAVTRMLGVIKKQKNIKITFATCNNKLVGFSIDELLRNGYVMSHYFKTLSEVIGLSEYLNQRVAQYLNNMGCRYWNWEQDLGIDSLRNMKMSYRPCHMLKKYIIKQ